MGSEPNWPVRGGRYDPYDPRHPMWTDPFWAAYCANPQRAAAEPNPAGWLQAAAGPPAGLSGGGRAAAGPTGG
jgi:hypothetical protein